MQPLAHIIDLLHGEIFEDKIQNLRKTQPLLAADFEARDALAVQYRLTFVLGGGAIQLSKSFPSLKGTTR